MTEKTKINIKKVILCHFLMMLPVIFQLSKIFLIYAVSPNKYNLTYSEVFSFNILYIASLYVVFLIARPIYGFLVTFLSWKWSYIITIMFKPIVLNTKVWSKIPKFISVPLGMLFYVVCLAIPLLLGFVLAFIE